MITEEVIVLAVLFLLIGAALILAAIRTLPAEVIGAFISWGGIALAALVVLVKGRPKE